MHFELLYINFLIFYYNLGLNRNGNIQYITKRGNKVNNCLGKISLLHRVKSHQEYVNYTLERLQI